MLNSVIAAGNSFQMVGAEKLKERLLKSVAQEGTHKRFCIGPINGNGQVRFPNSFVYITTSFMYSFPALLRKVDELRAD